MDEQAARSTLLVAIERLDRIRRKHHLIPGVIRTDLAVLSDDLDAVARAIARPDPAYTEAAEAEHAERNGGKRRARQAHS